MADTKWSQFPSETPGNSDEVVGLHSGDNARFSIANVVAAVRNGLANIFVPKTDVGAAGGVASLDSNGKVPSGQLPSSTGPEPATARPLMDGTGAVGTSTKYAREDHEHPADTNKQNKITASGILKGNGQGGVSAATPGTDYQAPLTAGTDYATPTQLADKAAKTDLTSIQATGTTNTTGAAIPAGAYFYLNGVLYRAKVLIDQNATFTVNTNCEQVPEGGLNSLAPQIITDAISNPFNRVNITKQLLAKYPNGKVELHIEGTITASLSSSQQALARIEDTQARPSAIVGGVGTIEYTPFLSYIYPTSLNGNISLVHSGASVGKPFSIDAFWYI